MVKRRDTLWAVIRQGLRRLSISGPVEVVSLGAIVVGVGMWSEPLAVILAGLGGLLWAQGRKP